MGICAHEQYMGFRQVLNPKFPSLGKFNLNFNPVGPYHNYFPKPLKTLMEYLGYEKVDCSRYNV